MGTVGKYSAMSRRSEVLFVSFLIFATTLAALGQQPTSPNTAGVGSAMSGVSMHGTGGSGTVQVSVKDDKNARLEHRAVVSLYEERSKFSTWQPTSKGSDVTFDQLGPGKYDFQISAVGYLAVRKDVEITVTSKPVHLDVVLRADPDAIEFSAADPSLPPKAAKETEKGVNEFESGNMKDAQKHLESALKEAPTSSHANFLVGYLYFQQNNVDQAQTYLTKATSLDPKNVQALDLLGRIYLSRKDFANAQSTAEQAVAAAPDNATAHGLLADAYLNQKDYKNALAQADLSLDKGKSHASNSQIVRGEALANLGHDQEAIAALKMYLDSAPDSAAGPTVKQWIDILEKRHTGAAPAPATAQTPKQ
jgi:predicted negative regulator of RcsB-dependent stress response